MRAIRPSDDAGPLKRFLSPLSLAAKNEARRRRRDSGSTGNYKRRIRRRQETGRLRAGREQDGGISPAGDPISFGGKEMGERNRRGPFHKGPPDPSSRPRGEPRVPPIGSSLPGTGGRGTGDTDCHNQSADWFRNHHVYTHHDERKCAIIEIQINGAVVPIC